MWLVRNLKNQWVLQFDFYPLWLKRNFIFGISWANKRRKKLWKVKFWLEAPTVYYLYYFVARKLLKKSIIDKTTQTSSLQKNLKSDSQ